MYVCMYMYVCIHACMLYIHTYIHTYMHTHVCVHTKGRIRVQSAGYSAFLPPTPIHPRCWGASLVVFVDGH